MPPRAIWKGAISFGMVVIPVKLFAGTEGRDIRFSNLHSTCHTRLRQKRWCPHHEVEVSMDEILKGYEFTKDQYVIMEDVDFENLPVPSKHTIDIGQFADLSKIEPIFFERTYLLEPEDIGRKPYILLKRVMEETNRVAIGKLSLRQKEHVVCVRPYEDKMALATMYHADEVRGTGEVVDDGSVVISEQELTMASSLVDQLTREFEAQDWQDDYRVALEQVIEAKLGTAEPVVAAPEPVKARISDLSEALKASIEAVKAERDAEAKGKAPAKKAG